MLVCLVFVSVFMSAGTHGGQKCISSLADGVTGKWELLEAGAGN